MLTGWESFKNCSVGLHAILVKPPVGGIAMTGCRGADPLH